MVPSVVAPNQLGKILSLARRLLQMGRARQRSAASDAQLSTTQTKSDSAATIGSLPAEILLLVLVDVVNSTQDALKRVQTVLTLRMVCTSWDYLICGAPTFWTTVVFSADFRPSPLLSLGAFHDAEFDMIIDLYSFTPLCRHPFTFPIIKNEFDSILSDYLSLRWKSLIITLSDRTPNSTDTPHLLDEANLLRGSACKHLRALTLSDTTLNWDQISLSGLKKLILGTNKKPFQLVTSEIEQISACAPHLVHLTIHRCNAVQGPNSWPRLLALRSLSVALEHNSRRILGPLLTTMHSLPVLESLEISNISIHSFISGLHLASNGGSMGSMYPCLKHLSLSGTNVGERGLLTLLQRISVLQAPNLVDLRLACRDLVPTSLLLCYTGPSPGELPAHILWPQLTTLALSAASTEPIEMQEIYLVSTRLRNFLLARAEAGTMLERLLLDDQWIGCLDDGTESQIKHCGTVINHWKPTYQKFDTFADHVL